MAKWFDVDTYGQENPDGTAVVVYDKHAIQNAIIKFLSSEQGEYILLPNMGGVLDNALFSQLNPTTAAFYEDYVTKQLKDYFSDTISSISVIFNPNFEYEMWEVTVSYRDRLNDNQEVSMTIAIQDNNLVQDKFSSLINITSIGDNLYQDVLLIKDTIPDMKHNRLVYNFQESKMTWGNYVLINLTPASPEYATIRQLING